MVSCPNKHGDLGSRRESQPGKERVGRARVPEVNRAAGGSGGRDGRFRNWKHSLFHVGKLRLFIPHMCENKFPEN